MDAEGGQGCPSGPSLTGTGAINVWIVVGIGEFVFVRNTYTINHLSLLINIDTIACKIAAQSRYYFICNVDIEKNVFVGNSS